MRSARPAVLILGAALALAGAAPVAPAAPAPSFGPRPPEQLDSPPAPLGPLPRGTDRAARTPGSAAASLRGAPERAAAPRALVRGVSDGLALRRATPAGRAAFLARVRAQGGRIVRVPAEWRTMVRGRPAHPRDPRDPAYAFARTDAIVRAVRRAGLVPLLVLSHAPAWAEGRPRWRWAPAGAWAVDPAQLAGFSAALARRYDGAWRPRRGAAPLPRVTRFQIWNEPNLPAYLAPQWTAPHGAWMPWAPRHYRRMLNAAHDAIRRVQPGAMVLTAGLAPVGDPVDGRGRMSPLRFLRAFLCLDARGRPLRPRCADPPRFDALAFHPLSTGDPDRPAPQRLDVAVADLGKLTGALDTAVRAGILARRPPLWITELNWTSPRTARERTLRARWVGRAVQRLWRAGARAVLWQFERDRAGERPAGLRDAAGRPKPVLRAFRFPFDVVRTAPGRVRVFALPARPGRVCVQRRAGREWATLACARARPDRPLELRAALRGRAQLRAVAGGDRSAEAPAGR